jgi:GAF domain-containing protein
MSELLEEPGPGLASDEERRIVTLQELTARLARLSSSGEVAGFVLHEGVAKLGAKNGSLCLLAGDHLELTASVGYPEEVVRDWQRMPLDAATPAGECVLARQAIYCESIEELLARWPVFRDRPITGDPSFAVLPLETAAGAVLGTMVFGYAEPKRFGPDDRRFLEALAPEAATALERARANEALVAARTASESAIELLAFLAESSARLAASLDLEETLATISELAVPRVADRCVLYLSERSGELSKHLLSPLCPKEQAAADWLTLSTKDPGTGEGGAIGAVIATGKALYAAEAGEQALEHAAMAPQHLALLRQSGMGGILVVALHARGRRFGALAFVDRRGRPLTPNERALGVELAARASVAIDNARLFEREVHIAETLQRALLPEALPELDGVRLAATYKPGTRGLEVGGDWYDVVEVSPEQLVIVVGDVSGRGLSAARTMASLRYGIRAYALEGHPPSAILTRLGRLLDIRDDGHFATVLCGLVEPARRRVTIANAGHLDPLLVGNRGATAVTTRRAPPIGVAMDSTYPEVSLELAVGTTLLAFTDGLVERRGEHLDEGLQRLAAAAAARAGEELPELLDAILRELVPGGAEDDTAMLALRLTGAPEPSGG